MHADIYATKRDFWLCLARAFAPPIGDGFYAAFTKDLPDDLSAIAHELQFRIDGHIDNLRTAQHAFGDALEVQQLYAALFVTPPAPVLMNTAIYIDGAFLGQSEHDIGQWYGRHGYGRAEGFRDLSDHAAVQLEFIGLLYEKAFRSALADDAMEAVAYATEAERFLETYPKRWINPFLQALEQTSVERPLNGTYVHLARIVWQVIEQELATGTVRFEAQATSAFPEGSSRGMGALTAEDLAEIAFRLKSAGLGFDHVRDRPEWSEDAFIARCRDAAETYISTELSQAR